MNLPHAGCNWEECEICFPHLVGKIAVTDEAHFNRAVEVANGARLAPRPYRGCSTRCKTYR